MASIKVAKAVVVPPVESDPPAAAAAAVPTTSLLATSAIADDLERLLVDIVRRHPILYNRSHKLHNSCLHPVAHQAAWTRIAAEVRLDVGSCKSLWSCIKQKFIKYRKRISLGEEVSKEWPPYEAMHGWLDEHIQKRRSRVEMYKQICSAGQQSQSNGSTQPAEMATHRSAHTNSMDHQTLLDTFDSAVWSELPSTTSKPLPAVEPSSPRLNPPASSTANTAGANKTAPVPSKTAPLKRKASTIISIVTVAPQVKRPMKTEPLVRADTSEDEADGEEPLPEEQPSTTETIVPVAIAATRALPVVVALPNDAKVTVLQKTESKLTADAPVGQHDAAAETERKASIGCYTRPAGVDFASLERTVAQCVGLAERCAKRQCTQDPDEVFGTLIASMVRELPAERRRGARVRILDLVGDLLANIV